MKKTIIGLALLLLPLASMAEAFTATWDPVTTDTAGNTITVSGYNIYVSPTSGVHGAIFAAAVGSNSYKFTEIRPGTYFATVTAVASALESSDSNEASFSVAPKPPVMPTNFKIVIELSGTATVTKIQ